ncbi:MAG: Stp1/IreP family PP2C-type Ser/Thr phosphatase [Thermoleophilia bacterium]
MPATFSTVTHTGLVRKSNEDALFARAPVFVVADGMGGAQAGEVASGMATKAFEWFVPQTKSPEDELTRLIKRINTNIYELAAAESSRAGMGTTLTAAVVRSGNVILAHVGDSRAYLWRAGSLTQLTEDHSLVGEMVRSGQISSADAEEHPQRSIITRALGVDPQIEVDTRTLGWEPGDIFLLCSDGLYSMVHDDAIARILAQDGTLYTSAATLVEAANEAGGRDNISVIVFCPDGSVPAGIEMGPGSPTEKIDLNTVGAGAAAENVESDEAIGQTGMSGGRLAGLRYFLTSLPGRVAIGLVLAFLVLIAAWFGTRQAYYIGVDGDHLVIYQGVPYDLGPWSLSSLYRNSPVKVSELKPFQQDRVYAQELQSKSNAEQMLENYQAEEEAARRAAEEEQRIKNLTQNLTIPPGGMP